MRWLIAALPCGTASARATPCRLRAQPFLETNAGKRTLDLRRGEVGRVFLAVPAWVNDQAVVISEPWRSKAT